MKLNRALWIFAALLAFTLPAVAQDAPSAPPPVQPDSPACPDSTAAFPDEEASPIVPTIGGGGSCSGLSSCYCFCRYNHRCDLDPSECDPLSQCLNDCDAQYPGCPYPGGDYPSSITECL